MSCDGNGLLQVSYGKPVDVLKNAITSGILPESFVNYRQMNIGVFDIETLEEEPPEEEDVEGILRIASIGFASNLPDCNRFFVRKNSHPSSAIYLLEEFLNHCFEVEKLFNSRIPKDIKMALKDLDDSAKTKFSTGRTQKQNMLYNLKKYLEFPIFGYNSGNLKWFLEIFSRI